jgi:anti-sigma factor RsiW
LNCEDVIHDLSDFIDGDLDGALKQELESHLKDCEDCRLVVDQTRKTIEVFCDSEPVELPGEVRARLHDALRRKFKEAAH